MFGNKSVIPNGYNATQTDNAAYGSKVINSQLVNVYTVRALSPSQAAAPYWYGNGSKPPTLAGYSAAKTPVTMANAVGGGSLATSGDAGLLDMQNSPAMWAVIFLVVGFVGLRHIHWRAT
jgi:hypothetical protein